jgi:hypothetical protein
LYHYLCVQTIKLEQWDADQLGGTAEGGGRRRHPHINTRCVLVFTPYTEHEHWTTVLIHMYGNIT